MRALIVAALAVVMLRPAGADNGRSCEAICTSPDDCHKCSTGSTSSNDSAAMAAALAAERAKRAQIDHDNAIRERRKKHIHSVRSDDNEGVRAFKRKDFDGAVKRFERALALEPNNYLIQANLSAARAARDTAKTQRDAAKQERDIAKAARSKHESIDDALRRRRQVDLDQYTKRTSILAKRPQVPLESAGVVAAPVMPRTLPTHFDRDYVFNAIWAHAAAGAREVVLDAFEEITPEGALVRYAFSVERLASEEIPAILTHAVQTGEELHGDASVHAATVVMNFGTLPGQLAEKIVTVGSVSKVLADEAEARVTQLASRGIERLVVGLGARTLIPEGTPGWQQLRQQFTGDVREALRTVQQARAIQRWIEGATATPPPAPTAPPTEPIAPTPAPDGGSP